MKANEAPEKLYFTSNENGTHYYTEGIPFEREYIEYIQTDAFIEKAEKYLKSQFIKDVSVLAVGTVNVNFSAAIENFIKYMKGE
jgi:hypothetical protein